jgi:parvulin-like peptidyl-prolyl isomerase
MQPLCCLFYALWAREKEVVMSKGFTCFLSTLMILLITAFGAAAFGGSTAGTSVTDNGAATADVPQITIPLRINGKVEQIPLFSQQHQQLPVAMVNEEPITLRELATELASMHGNMGQSESRGKQDFSKILERLVTIRLIKQEALNIGFDRTPTFQKQVNDFAIKTRLQLLLNEQFKKLQLDEQEVEKTYRDMAIEAKLQTYSFTDQADAKAFIADIEAGGDFQALGEQQLAAGKAEGGEEEDYVKLIDLLPAIAKAVFEMEPNEVSEAFKGQDNYLVFRLLDKRVYEDPEVRRLATNTVLQEQRKTAQKDYFKALEERYVTFSEEGEKALNFKAIVAEQPGITGTEVFARLLKDQRPVATVSDGQTSEIITVAEIAEKLKAKMFHGTERELVGTDMDTKKDIALQDQIIALTVNLEAERQGIDATPEFKAAVAKFEERQLFDTFVAKAVIPGIKVPEDEAKAYYYTNLEDYSSPLMLKMRSLVFTDRASAVESLEKLRSGSDFRWVSANAVNLAEGTDVSILSLDGSLLSLTALPEDLQKIVSQARQGDLFLYDGPEELFYLLQVENAFPPKAQLYEEVRQDVGKIIYAQKIREAIDEWVTKLKEAYGAEIYVVSDEK